MRLSLSFDNGCHIPITRVRINDDQFNDIIAQVL